MVIRDPNTPHMISRRAVEDPDLSMKALGVLAVIQAIPGEGSFDTREIQKRKKIGRTALRSAILELEAGGYVTLKKEGK